MVRPSPGCGCFGKSVVSGRIFQSFSEAHLLVNSLKEFQVPAEAEALPLAKAWRTPRLAKNPWVLRTRPGAGGRQAAGAGECCRAAWGQPFSHRRVGTSLTLEGL